MSSLCLLCVGDKRSDLKKSNKIASKIIFGSVFGYNILNNKNFKHEKDIFTFICNRHTNFYFV